MRARRKPADVKSAYIMGPKFVVGLSAKRSAKYAEIIIKRNMELQKGSIKTKAEARQWVQRQLSST